MKVKDLLKIVEPHCRSITHNGKHYKATLPTNTKQTFQGDDKNKQVPPMWCDQLQAGYQARCERHDESFRRKPVRGLQAHFHGD